MTTDKITAMKDAILDIQRRQDANEEGIRKTSELRATKVAEIAALKTQSPQDITDRIVRDRRRLLANIARGLSTKADLSKFDRDATEEQKAIAKQSVPKEAIKDLEETVIEFDGEIKTLETAKVALAADFQAALLAYFKDGVAEYRGALVTEHGAIVRDNVAAVAACGSILHALQGSDGGVGRTFRDLHIPPLGTLSTALPYLDKFDAVFASADLYSLATDDSTDRFVNPSQNALIDAAEAAGIRCPANLRPAAAKPAATPSVAEAGAVNSATKLKASPGGILSTIAEKPRKGPGGAATLVDPKNPNALCGPQPDPRPIIAEMD